MRRRTALFVALLMPLWLAAALGVAEVVFRAFVRPPRQIIAHDPKLGWRYLPNVNAATKDGGKLTTNSRGFRGAEPEREPSKGWRILALGDSYTAGMHVADDDIFVTRIPQYLGMHGNPSVRSGSAPAWATDQELLFLESEGAAYRPSVVLLVVVPNDIRESYAKGFFRLDENGLLTGGADNVKLSAFDRLTWKLLNQSALVQWAGDKLGFLDVFRMLSHYYRFTFPIAGHEATDFDLFLKEEPNEIKQARKLFEALVLRMKDRCQKMNAKLVVTVLPTLVEFSWPMIGSKEHQPGIVSKRVADFSRAQKIEFVDLFSPAAQMGGDARTLFLDGDFHLSPKGHAFVAKGLEKALRPPGWKGILAF